MNIHTYPDDMTKVSSTNYTCPFCHKRTTFDILESNKYYNYHNNKYEYKGLEACCQNCGNYYLTDELAEMNLNRIKTVIYHSGNKEILKVNLEKSHNLTNSEDSSHGTNIST